MPQYQVQIIFSNIKTRLEHDLLINFIYDQINND